MPAYTDRRLQEEIVFRVGEKRRIAHVVSGDGSFAPVSVTCTIYNAGGTAVVTAGAGGTDGAEGVTETEVYYLWDTTGAAAGDYTYQLSWAIGGETFVAAGDAYLVAAPSKFDAWAGRIRRWTMESGVGEAQRALSLRHYRDAAVDAVREFERVQPQRPVQLLTLAGGQFEYALPDGTAMPTAPWVNNFSGIRRIEYPVEDNVDLRVWLENYEWEIDEVRGVWRFSLITPGAGEQARVYYTTRQVLSDAVDTTPPGQFDAIAQYAAGTCLMMLASRAAGTQSPVIGAEMVNYRTKQQEYRQQALEMQKAARATWGIGDASAIVETDYFRWHGRVIYWQ